MSDTAAPAPAATARSYGPRRQKVPPFARFKGTSAWKKYRRRAHEYARHLAATRKAAEGPGATTA